MVKTFAARVLNERRTGNMEALRAQQNGGADGDLFLKLDS